MKELIEALQAIWPFMNKPDTKWPTSCEHDMMYVCDINFDDMSGATVRKIASLGFNPGDGDYDFRIIENILGHDFAIGGDYTKITDEQWESIKHEITNCFSSYHFGSC